jgi:hypothetical protein
MHLESVQRSGASRPIVVGDRLDTDIEGANAAGCPSLLVFTGVTDVARLLRARPEHRPTYVAADLCGLLETHPEPHLEGDTASCGRWRAAWAQTVLRLIADRPGPPARTQPSGHGEQRAQPEHPDGSAGALDRDALDAVRALCLACWSLDAAQHTDLGEAVPADVEGGDPAAAAMVHRLGLARAIRSEHRAQPQ